MKAKVEMKARSLMTAQPVVIAECESLQRAAQIMSEIDVGALPVVDSYEHGHLVGIITDRDIVVRHVALGGSRDCCVKDHMSHGIEVVHPDADVRDVLGRMAAQQVRRIPVVDDDHIVVGVITQADIARRIGPYDAEAVEDVVERISEPSVLIQL
jgi:CBS domain-containing protein